MKILVVALVTLSGMGGCHKDDPEKLLTEKVWKADEVRVQLSNKSSSFYKRNEVGNMYDSDSLKFNPDNTGSYYFQGESFPINWKFTDFEKTKMYITIDKPPAPYTVYLENIQLSKSSFKYVQYFTGEVSYLASATRTPN